MISNQELNKIKEDFNSKKETFKNIGEFFVNKFSQIPSVHVLNYRVKDTEHLIEKIKVVI